MAKAKPGSVDALIAEWRAAGVEIAEGPTVALPATAPQTRSCAIPTVNCAQLTDGVVVDVPPSVNSLFRGGGKEDGHRRFSSKEYRRWTKANGWKLAALAAAKEYPVAAIFTVECTLRKGCDLDNLCKAILDTMKKVGVIVDDDWQHVSSVTIRHRPCGGSGVRVQLEKA